jgi:alpha-D-xyloside xylohydrolase
MIKELQALNIELLVSIWPTVDKQSENYDYMLEHGMLIRQDRGLRIAMDFQGETVHADFTNPITREFVWDIVKKNYHDKGVKMFWLDEAEPEYSVYDFDLYRYHSGSVLSSGNFYPVEYARTFYDGMTAAGQGKDVCNLIRCAWAGSQKYGTLLWSGDIASSWESFRDQFAAGLNVGIAGIPWWVSSLLSIPDD